jgi:hypothetical protein
MVIHDLTKIEWGIADAVRVSATKDAPLGGL